MKIGQAASASGISERMIRHYEKIGLMPAAARRDSGYRDYDGRDVNTLTFISRARDLGFSIEEIGKLLELWQDRSRASHDVKELALARAAELKRKERALHEMRRSLEHLAASCHGDDRPDCPILGELEGQPAALSQGKATLKRS
ncbi:MAG TPA: Cu(I)-responsive transcriptional regulator [Xanthobacteraceae bacterium]|nr:Cu(I)-responsive transcriptional regulator [Xanthobacteraceae bacterium]